VGSLIELLGIKGGAEAEGHTGAEEDVVGDGCDTAVVDLDLYSHQYMPVYTNQLQFLPWRMKQDPVCTWQQPQDRPGYQPWSPR
jgi:hypothetical protein